MDKKTKISIIEHGNPSQTYLCKKDLLLYLYKWMRKERIVSINMVIELIESINNNDKGV